MNRIVPEGSQPEAEVDQPQKVHWQGLAARLSAPQLRFLSLCSLQRRRINGKELGPPKHDAAQERLQRCGHKSAGKGVLGDPAESLPIAAV